MPLNETTIFVFFILFCRISACFFTSPFFGNHTPPLVRVFFCAVTAYSLVPVLQSSVPAVPKELWSFGMMMGNEILVGILIGGTLQLFLLAVQMAGSILDFQLGMSSSQVFNPLSNQQVTLFSNLKTWLALVLLLLMNGHHMMLAAFVNSYKVAPTVFTHGVQANMIHLMGNFALLTLQMAAPAAAVALLIDVAAGLVNKSVPQMQVYLVAMPGKVIMGVMTVSMALPVLVVTVQSGLEHAFQAVTIFKR